VPNDAATEELLERCAELEPKVASGKVVDVKVGLRPSRPTVRNEVEIGTAKIPIVHNYGHGASGVKTSWGCAWSVVSHCRDLAT
jgi:D-amino-acid oxidase